MSIPKRVCERITSAMKRLLPIIEQQKARDVSEADTVTLVKDILSDAFGFDKYTELTGELAIRGTYCDLAVKLDDKIVQLIETKAIGIELSDRHVKQAIDYAANQGIEWVILTNAIIWRLYEVIFGKPIDKKLIAEVNIAACDCRRDADLEQLYLFTKEGFKKGIHIDLRDRRDATSRFMIAALLLHNEDVRSAIRRELRRIVEVSVADEEIRKVLHDEVIKRDTLEGPESDEAAKRVARAVRRSLRESPKSPSDVSDIQTIETAGGDDPLPTNTSAAVDGPATE